ncbi:MAG: phosphopyruvate hydratase [Ruminococcaceae bacterium]|nr:phosphopyruvate hydratase [Oscillospiraceae bacterium]
MIEITKICAREILDSRGNPTVEAEVTLSDGTKAVAAVPSGASTGMYEAKELRDEADTRYHKRGVLSAVKNVNERIHPALVGMDACDIEEADSVMIALDGTYNKSNLGANAILSVSMALAKAGAAAQGIPLYRYLGGVLVKKIPVPMMNILNGGAHAANNIDIQEFMIIPIGATNFAEGVRMCSEIYHTLKNILLSKGLLTAVGDEGGFAPMLPSDEEALGVVLSAIEKSGYRAGEDIMLGLDAAASEWKSEDGYVMPKRNRRYTSDELVDYFERLSVKYPILSIEDGVADSDSYGWRRLTERLSGKCLLVGDDLFVTDSHRIEDGISSGIANAALIKPNQIGTLTETAEAVFSSRRGGYKTAMSHRSGDTADDFIADLAVSLSCDFIKAGAPARAERCVKYNRLMKIESEIFSPSYGI